jgi:hypothetical protein
MFGNKKPLSVSRYMHGNAHGVTRARREGLGAMGERKPGEARLGRKTAPDSNGVELRDPLEVLLLGGDRDEYVDRSFWHDAEADGVTFQESRVDGRWDEDGGEWWK